MNVGDYVRTKEGIEKIIFKEENFMDNGLPFYATDSQEWRGSYNGKYYGFTNRNRTIIKSSPNIIDLIEVGDYVNGYKVISLWKDKTKVIGVAVDGSVIGFDECEIKSIVTKEQFEQMEYKIQ